MNTLQLELESVRVLLGTYGTAEERQIKLSLLNETYGEDNCAAVIQDYVNRILGNSEMLGDALADYILSGSAGSGDDRSAHLGAYYQAAQERVNQILMLRGLSKEHVAAVLVNRGFGSDEAVKELRLRACGYDPAAYLRKPGNAGNAQKPGQTASSAQKPARKTSSGQTPQDASSGRLFKLFFINHERYTWKENWGDNCLVESDGRFLLMDSCMPAARDAILNFLKTRKVDTLSLYISHPHYDHYGNAMAILKDPYFTVEHMYLCKYGQISGIDDANVKMHYNNIRNIGEYAKSHGIPITWLSEGVSFTVGAARFDILYDMPLDMTHMSKGGRRILNDMSPVCMVTLGEVKYLTCGDAFTDVEDIVLGQNIDVRAAIYKMQHHGGNEANSKRWLEAVSPRYAVYNNGEGSGMGSEGWTRQAFENAHHVGAKVYNPTYHGNIIFTVEGGEISVWTERHGDVH